MPSVLQVVLGLGALITALFGLYKHFNVRSSSYTHALNALALAEAYEKAPVQGDDPVDVEHRKLLQRRLADVAYYQTGIFLRAASPTVTDFWQPAIFFIIGIGTFIVYAIKPVTGGELDTASFVATAVLALGMLASGAILLERVERHKMLMRLAESDRKKALTKILGIAEEESSAGGLIRKILGMDSKRVGL
ncbi:hypothetical protein [Pseudarthrobacter sp. PS3-L1]|uniref:hypothetical protein n=1 Tax=Pseudarthrobacter sp. PS3-L1 TaxID=3046207 RepID=UPI0024B94160|nr:hypothetical protein [Pseudarthrobacter sp. PS3-L1]MDJ0321999.1 hypothetical protein [Pseudarthrobacter sp. PS3-L1]